MLTLHFCIHPFYFLVVFDHVIEVLENDAERFLLELLFVDTHILFQGRCCSGIVGNGVLLFGRFLFLVRLVGRGETFGVVLLQFMRCACPPEQDDRNADGWKVLEEILVRGGLVRVVMVVVFGQLGNLVDVVDLSVVQGGEEHFFITYLEEEFEVVLEESVLLPCPVGKLDGRATEGHSPTLPFGVRKSGYVGNGIEPLQVVFDEGMNLPEVEGERSLRAKG